MLALVVLAAGAAPAAAGRAEQAVRAFDTRALAGGLGSAEDAITGLAEQLPAGAHAVTNRNGRQERTSTVTDLVLGMRRYDDTAAWLRTAADLVTLTSEDEPDVAAAAHSPSGAVVDAIGAGDLDGDGRDDVLAVTADLSTKSVTMQARRGHDAAVLWERTAGDDGALVWPLGADVDGDGIDDLSVRGLQIHHEDVVEECEDFYGDQWCWPVEYHATYTWTLGVASGATGTALWSRTEDGQIDESYTYEETGALFVYDYAERYELESTNLYALGLHAGDLAGTGRDDLVVETISLDVLEAADGRDAGLVWWSNGGLQVRAVTQADIADAATGAVHHSFRDDAEGRVSFLFPVDDVVGGSGPDLLWDTTVAPDQSYACMTVDLLVDGMRECEDEPDGGWAADLSVIDGESFAPAWTVSFADGWFGFPLGADVDADGRGDFMMLGWGDEGEVTTVLSGATGATLWEHESTDDFLFPIVTGPIDDAPGDDLVTTSFVWDWDTRESEIVVDRRSGRTGEVISTDRHALPTPGEDENYTMTFLYAAGAEDGDGDGVGDLTVGWIRDSYRFDDASGDIEHVSLVSRAYAKSGRTGDIRRDLHVEDAAAALFPTADLDGDGLIEVFEQRYVEAEVGPARREYTALPFQAGAPLWTVAGEGDWVWLDDAGDVDDAPGEDLLLSSYFVEEDDVWSSTVQLLSGQTGAERWRLSTR